MANNVFKLRRSSVAGKTPNTSTLSIGELALNLADQKLFSSDGSNIFELGANVTNQFVYSTLSVGNSTVNTTVSNGNLTINGSAVSPVQSFRNKIINGNFDFWQRANSVASVASGQYVADRWVCSRTGSTASTSRQSFTVGQTDVPNEPTYWFRNVVTTSAGAGNYFIQSQRIESVRTLAGQSAVLSFYAKADASKNMAVEFIQSFGTGGSPSALVTAIGVTTCALTTSWQKFTIPVSISSISTKTLGTNNDDYLGVVFWMDAGSTYNARTNSLGQQSGTFDIAQVQFEAGSVATPFEMRPLGIELALCQRYYSTVTTQVTAVASNPAKGVFYKTSMRALPTISGGGSGFTAVNQTTDGMDCVQTTAANQTLTFSAEL